MARLDVVEKNSVSISEKKWLIIIIFSLTTCKEFMQSEEGLLHSWILWEVQRFPQ